MAPGLAEQRPHQAVAVDDAGRGRQQRGVVGERRLERAASLAASMGAGRPRRWRARSGDRLQRRLGRGARVATTSACRSAQCDDPCCAHQAYRRWRPSTHRRALSEPGGWYSPAWITRRCARADAGAEGGLRSTITTTSGRRGREAVGAQARPTTPAPGITTVSTVAFPGRVARVGRKGWTALQQDRRRRAEEGIDPGSPGRKPGIWTN